ncbi:MAG: hypothetical protein WD492_06035 [Alkalispirochaeta sp.]
MRKTFLVLLAMTMVATMAFAQVQVEYDLGAEATATFGVNLDKATAGGTTAVGPTTGFQLATDVDFSITLVEETTEEFGEGDVYGWLEIDGFEFSAENEGNVTVAGGDVSAKLFLGPAYIVIATAANDVNQGELGLNVDESILDLSDALSKGDVGNSVAVGFDVPDLFNVEAVIGSYSTDGVGGTHGTNNDWSDNLYNNYVGAIYTETSVAGFTFTADFAATLRNHRADGTNDAGDVDTTISQGDFGDDGFIGLGVDYSMALNDAMNLVPYLGVDLKNKTDVMDYEVIAGANVLWGADDLEVFGAASDETAAGLGLEVGLNRVHTDEDNFDDALWVRAGFAEEGGDDGLLPVVGAALLVEFAQTTPTVAGDAGDAVSSLSFGAEVDAALGTLSPFFGLMYADANLDADDDEGMTMKLGTDINVIPATTFTIAYNSGNLLLTDDDGVYDGDTYSYNAANDGVTGKLGTFTIATKIEY